MTIAPVTGAELALMVNGLDTSMPIEIEDRHKIIISVTDGADAQSYSVICTLGGKLTPLSDPNTSDLQQAAKEYLFAFDDEETSLATVDLTVGEVLDYQLALFRIPDANVVVFGIDSDTVQIEPEPTLEQQAQPKEQPCQTQTHGLGALSAGDCNEILDPNCYPNLDNDSFVNFEDFAILAGNWLKSGTALGGDFDEGRTVDASDLHYFSYFWLASACSPTPEEVFAAFKAALLAGNIDGALTFVADASRDRYAQIFAAIEPNLPDFAAGLGDLTLSSQGSVRVVYEMAHQDAGQTYSFPVVFVRDERGSWKIFNF